MTAACLIAADLPYAGKWKLNPSKSDFGDTTVTYEQAPAGEMKATMDGQSYTFKTDGKEYSNALGNDVRLESRRSEHVGDDRESQREGHRHQHDQAVVGR